MAYEGIQTKLPGVTASADLRTKQYHFVKVSGNNTVTVCAAATDIPVGVLQNAPNSGEAAEVAVLGVTKVVADKSLAAGVLIGTSGDGQADDKTAGTDTTNYVVGQCISGVSNAGEIATVLINCAAPARGA